MHIILIVSTALASPTTQIIGINRELLTFSGLQSIKPTPGDTSVKILVLYQDFYREYHRAGNKITFLYSVDSVRDYISPYKVYKPELIDKN